MTKIIDNKSTKETEKHLKQQKNINPDSSFELNLQRLLANKIEGLIMKVETLKDVLEYTKSTHRNLSECLTYSAQHNDSERARMLLNYLAEHEKALITVLQGFIDTSDTKVLSTWCLEFLDRQPTITDENCNTSFIGQGLSEIMEAVVAQHHQIISLYKHLHATADIPSLSELTEQLIELEEHHVMQMVQGSNRMEDI